MNTAKAAELLRASRCPDPMCDNYGTTVKTVTRWVPICCMAPQGFHCCGNPVPVESHEHQPARCQWCHERAALLCDPSLLIPPKTRPDRRNILKGQHHAE